VTSIMSEVLASMDDPNESPPMSTQGELGGRLDAGSGEQAGWEHEDDKSLLLGPGGNTSVSVLPEANIGMSAIDKPPRPMRYPSGLSDTSSPWRKQLSLLLEHPDSSMEAAIIQSLIVILILTSTIAVVLETEPGFRGNPVFFQIEVLVTLLFTLEFVLRLLASDNIAHFFMNGFNIIDLLAILPGYVEMVRRPTNGGATHAMMSLRMIRLMWVARILRLLKVTRHSKLSVIILAVLTKVWHSSIIVVVMLLGALTLVSASLLYLVESDRCEELGVQCTGFDSIPAASWFAIVTATTVGYGDRVPATLAGKMIAGATCVAGVMSLAMAGALLSFDFAEQFREQRASRHLQARRQSEDMEGNRELQELQLLVRGFRTACDDLVDRVSYAASHSESPKKPVLRPMLRLLHDHKHTLCLEVQNYVWNVFEADEAGEVREDDNRDPDCEESEERALVAGSGGI